MKKFTWNEDGGVHTAATLFGRVTVKTVTRESDGKEFGYLLMPGDTRWADFNSVAEAKEAAEYLCNFPV